MKSRSEIPMPIWIGDKAGAAADSQELAKWLTKAEIENKFIEIFHNKISHPNEVIGQPDLNDPQVKFIYIKSALEDLCREPGFPPEPAASIQKALRLLDMQVGISRSYSGDVKLAEFNAPHNRLALAKLVDSLRPIFSEEVIALIERQL